MADVVSGSDALSALMLCGLMGILGQGVRATIGLKNANAINSSTPNSQSAFSAAYFFLSLMIGFIAGILAGIAIGLGNFTHVDLSDTKVLLGVAGSGYLGADFIENSLSLVVPASAPTPAPAVPPTPPQPPATNPDPATTLVPLLAHVAPVLPAADTTALKAAFKIVAPKVDTNIWVPALIAAFPKFDVTNNKRIAAAVGQFLVEAGAAFQEVVENLNYTHAEHIFEIFPHAFANADEAEAFVGRPEALGNRVYANRLGNGDEASGDGFRFRGRSLIQLTGRDEYSEFGATVQKTPEEVSTYCETVEGAAMAGCWYLSSRGCLPLADVWNISAITLKVNGKAMLGNTQRIAYANAFLKALGG